MIRRIRVDVKNPGGKLLLVAFAFILTQGAIKSCQLSGQDAMSSGQASMGNRMLTFLAEGMEEALYRQFVPSYAMGREAGDGAYWLLQKQIGSLVPIYEYMAEGVRENSYVSFVPGETGTATTLTMEELLETENMLALEDLAKAAEEAALQQVPESTSWPVEESLPELPPPGVGFIPHALQMQVDLSPLSDYETLLQQFYTVDANTLASSERLNVHKFVEKDMTISKETEGPQILIFHTHASEEFADSVEMDKGTTIVGAGEHLAWILQETYGYKVLHHQGQYDNTGNDAYGEALPEITKLLRDNPSISVVIDLHRDEMPEGTKLVMDLDGRPTARFMFFNGLSKTRKTGNISYLKNENLDDNLAFSFQMQRKAMEYYPGLTRKIYLKGYRYNMHLVPRYLLVELGAQNNTVEEAMNACDPLAHILDLVLSGE